MNSIVMLALRNLIMDSNASEYDRNDALTEYVNLSAKQVVTYKPAPLNITALTDILKDKGRIAAIKHIRAHTGYGLRESLIIVKGIEAHERIL